MAVRVSLTPRASADIRAIREYLITRNAVAADRVRKAISATLLLLSEHPGAGRKRHDLDARAIGMPRFPIPSTIGSSRTV